MEALVEQQIDEEERAADAEVHEDVPVVTEFDVIAEEAAADLEGDDDGSLQPIINVIILFAMERAARHGPKMLFGTFMPS